VTRLRVLIVDDDDDIRAVARMSLERLGGHAVEEAVDGRGGIDRCIQGRPDVVLLDFMMPDRDGLECLACLRRELGADLPPVLLMTARSERPDPDPPGLAGFIAKPFEPAALVRAVQHVVER